LIRWALMTVIRTHRVGSPHSLYETWWGQRHVSTRQALLRA